MPLRFLLSDKNLAGLGLAAVVMFLYIINLVTGLGLLLAPVGYAVGLLCVPDSRTQLALPSYESTEQRLAWLTSCIQKLPKDASQKLQDILSVAQELLPRLKEMEKDGTLLGEHRATFKRTITEYLPVAVESYLKLPALYARTVKVKDNKTAQVLLCEQLDLLHNHVLEIQSAVLSQEIGNLLLNGKFLQQKFQESSLVLSK